MWTRTNAGVVSDCEQERKVELLLLNQDIIKEHFSEVIYRNLLK